MVKIEWDKYQPLPDQQLLLFCGHRLLTYSTETFNWSTGAIIHPNYVYNLHRRNTGGIRVYYWPLLITMDGTTEKQIREGMANEWNIPKRADLLLAAARAGFDIFQWIPEQRAFDQRYEFNKNKFPPPRKKPNE